jgi:hypothetical protein
MVRETVVPDRQTLEVKIRWFLHIRIHSLTHNVSDVVLKTDNAEGPNSKRFQI